MPRNITVTFGDGSSHVYNNAPDDITPDAVQARAEKEFFKTVKGIDGGKSATPATEEPKGLVDTAVDAISSIAPARNKLLKDALGGAVRGAGSVGATLLAPYDMAKDALNGKGLSLDSNRERRAGMDAGLKELGADPDSMAYGAGKLGAEIAGTAGVGGLLAKGAAAIPGVANAAPGVVNALRTSGMTTGLSPATLAGKAGDLALRTGASAAVGGASAGLVDPESAGTGALIGGAMPGVTKAFGSAGSAVGKYAAKLAQSGVPDDVAKLAVRAKELGVDIPADRLVNNRPMNALAAGLNYVPFSGRAASEDLMSSQLNKAVSNTFGQDSSNVTMALRRANDQLGMKFDQTLKNTGVNFDKQLFDDAAATYNRAEKELGSDALRPIKTALDDLFEKGQSGVIDGQAAYNIKKNLDRIGKGSSNEAFHARELKDVLMDALNRSLGPKEAAAFATTRQQYGNMRSLEKLAKNGAEGEISVARLANMKNINNESLQEIADIAAQFVKPRESQHGGAQRALVGAAAAFGGGIPATAAGIGAGRAANSVLNSQRLKNLMLGESQPQGAIGGLLKNPEALQLLTRSAPVVGAQ